MIKDFVHRYDKLNTIRIFNCHYTQIRKEYTHTFLKLNLFSKNNLLEMSSTTDEIH